MRGPGVHDGRNTHFEDPVGPVAPAGALRFVVAQAVDITDRKALAETLERREAELRHAQKVDSIGRLARRLAAGVAHDFNNLLTIIMGHGEVLMAEFADVLRQVPGGDHFGPDGGPARQGRRGRRQDGRVDGGGIVLSALRGLVLGLL
jgi:signal transduction histidine kinase